MINKNLFTKKLNGPGLRYELAVSLKTNNIVWLSGPHLPGMKNDLQIFRCGLKHMLDEGERCEADMIYRGEAPAFIKCPGMVGVHDKERGKKVEGRHETINNRLKFFLVLPSDTKGNKILPRTRFETTVPCSQQLWSSQKFRCNLASEI